MHNIRGYAFTHTERVPGRFAQNPFLPQVVSPQLNVSPLLNVSPPGCFATPPPNFNVGWGINVEIYVHYYICWIILCCGSFKLDRSMMVNYTNESVPPNYYIIWTKKNGTSYTYIRSLICIAIILFCLSRICMHLTG